MAVVSAFQHVVEQNAADLKSAREDLRYKLMQIQRGIERDLSRIGQDDFIPDLGYASSVTDAVELAGKVRLLVVQAQDLATLARMVAAAEAL